MEEQYSGHVESVRINPALIAGAIAISGLLTVATKAKGYFDRYAQTRRDAETFAEVEQIQSGGQLSDETAA
jgi:hypothetical protein